VPVLAKIGPADLLLLKELIEAGSVAPVIDRTYPLDEAADALRYLGAGHVQGKVIVSV
jgi:NADPH:quinone reductase-like Zn-dependent oxidoreductase